MSPRILQPNPARPGRFYPRRVVIPVYVAVALFLLSGLTAAVSGPPSLNPHHSFTTRAAGAVAPLGPQVSSLLSTRPTLARPSGTEGSIVSTIDLVDDRVLPGNTALPVQSGASLLVFDPNNGDFYVRGGLGSALTVLSGTTDRVVASIAVPLSQNPYSLAPTVAVDTTTGSVYVSNGFGFNLTVIDGATNRVTGSAPVGGTPNGIAFDSDNGYLYAANWGTANVSAVDGSTNALVHSIPVGNHPGPILYDPASKQVFVANWADGNVSVINTTTNLVVANLNTGISPVALALDTHDDYVDVANDANGAPSHVTVIGARSDAILANVSVGSGPLAFAYAPIQDEMYVANSGSTNVSVLNQSLGSITATLAVGRAPTAETYDPSNGDVYVANQETPNVTVIRAATHGTVTSIDPNDGLVNAVATDLNNGNVFVASAGGYYDTLQSNATVINGSTNRPIASIPLDIYPTGLTVDASNGNLLAQDPGGNDTYRIDATTGLIAGTVPNGINPRFSAFDTVNGELYVVNTGSDNVTVLSSMLRPIASIPLGVDPTGITFDSRNGHLYVSDGYGGNLTVIDGATHLFVRSIVLKPYENLAAVLYDPHSDRLYVADRSAGNVSMLDPNTDALVKNITVGVSPTSLAYDSLNHTVFVANFGSGNVSVINDTTNTVVQGVTLYDPGLLAYDARTDVMYDALSYAAAVNAVDASTYASAGPLLQLASGQYASGIACDAANGLIYVSSEYGGSISVISSVPQYPVTFLESGLPAGTGWSVTLNGSLNSSTSTSLGFGAANGSYPFQVGTVTGYLANVTSGTVMVAGAPVTVLLGFSASSTGANYPVTFAETGLPASTPWNVTLAGQLISSSNSTVRFSEPNGTYSFAVGAVLGYTSNPSSGSVNVAGLPQTENITFAFGVVPLTASLTATPSTVTVGSKTLLATTTAGGSGPFSYTYTGLPSNCTTANASSLNCVPAATGTFTVNVAVSDGQGHHANASTTLTVQSSGSTQGPAASSGISVWTWGIVVILIAALLALFFFLAYRRRQRAAPPGPGPGPTTLVGAPAGTGEPPSAGSGPPP